MNGGPSQAARVLDAAVRDLRVHKLARQINIEHELSEWRKRWRTQRQSGFKQDLSLPEMTGAQVKQAMKIAHACYWNPCILAVYGEEKKMLQDCRNAILAADARKRRRLSRKSCLRTQLYQRDGNCCWLCGEELGDDCTIEHRKALANGGTWAFDNLVLVHFECNQSLGRLPNAAKSAAREAIAGRSEVLA